MELRIISETDHKLEIGFTGMMDIAGVGQVETKFYAYLNSIDKPVFVDFSGVEFLSSIGIRLLISGWKITKQAGFPFKILNVKDEVRKVMLMAGLDEMMD